MTIKESIGAKLVRLGGLLEKGLEKLGIQLVDDAKHFWKLYSFWFFMFLLGLPDLYNGAISQHVIDAARVPPAFTYLINVISFVGFGLRMMKQKAADVGHPVDEQPNQP